MLIRNLVDIWTMSMVRTALLQGRLDGQLNVGRPTCALHGGQWEILCRSRLDDAEQVRLSALREGSGSATASGYNPPLCVDWMGD